MRIEIRQVEAGDWLRMKELRLRALADPVSEVAFGELYEDAVGYPDDVWRDRVHRTRTGETAATFVAVDADGTWIGMVTGVVEPAGEEAPKVPQVHLVGMYVVPEFRGAGVAEPLVGAFLDWVWERPEDVQRVRLWVHGENRRAEGFYRRLGFAPDGGTMPFRSALAHRMLLARPARSARRNGQL
ncbi:GNAT family N-acetyltransferase [Streptomyces sp. NPDC059637]